MIVSCGEIITRWIMMLATVIGMLISSYTFSEPSIQQVGSVTEKQLPATKKVDVLRNNPFIAPSTIVYDQVKTNTELNVVPVENLELRAILFSKKNSLVNLNGEIVAVGDEVQGYRVDKVFESHIELSKKQRVYRVELLEEDPA